VGQPVRFELASTDVIHSFWIPQLAGKMDVIPGQTNVMWLQADQPGVYRGQCAAFCGAQHAHMALLIVADTPEDFAAWQDSQLIGIRRRTRTEKLFGASGFFKRTAPFATPFAAVIPCGSSWDPIFRT
jgi:cytochrome c oxidase subunit 2